MSAPVPPPSLFNTLELDIAAPAAKVWELFLDRAKWMQNFVSRELLPAAAGARERARVMVESAANPERIEDTLHLEPGRRLVVRITAPGSAAFAHTDFLFEPARSGCRVRVSIHTVMEGTPARQDVERFCALTQGKIHNDFARLKQTAESAANTK